MALNIPSLPALTEQDLKIIEAVAQTADDRYAGTIKVLVKEVRRFQEVERYLKDQLHQALNVRKMPRE